MSASKMSILARAVFIVALAIGVVAKAPMSEHEHTETAMPQEIGTITSDGFLIYSMNHCIVTQTTNCEVSLSTGPPAAETPGDDASSGVVSEGTTVTDIPGGEYPVPTVEPGEGEPGPPGEGEPTDGGEPGQTGEPTEGNESATPTDATGSPSNTAVTTETETGDGDPSPTEGDDGATETETAATGTATAGSSITTIFEARVLGMAGLLAAYLL